MDILIPLVSNNMLSNLYADNIISGCETAVDYYRQARTIMGEARLNLRS